MAYQLEADPNLYSPEYWGADITDPSNFRMPNATLNCVNDKTYRKLAVVLATSLMDVRSDNYIETRLYDTEFSPSYEHLPNGSVIVMAAEQLVKQVGAESDNWESVSASSPPIEEPYAKYWLEHQSAGQSNFGVETVIFPDIQTIYSRYLEWGVLWSSRGQRVIKFWGLDSPFVIPGGIAIPTAQSKSDRAVYMCPLHVDTSHLLVDREQSRELRAIRRYTDLKHVKTFADENSQGNERKKPFQERVAGVVSNLGKAVLPAPSPLPVPA